jgi:hypothetical protein
MREDNWRAEREQRLAEREKRRTAGNNTARTSGSGSGAWLLGNLSRDGITESRGADIRLPTHISDIEKVSTPSTDRGKGNTLALYSTSGHGSPQQSNSLSPGGLPGSIPQSQGAQQALTNEGPQQQVPDPASRPSNGWWNSAFLSQRARPRTNESRV